MKHIYFNSFAGTPTKVVFDSASLTTQANDPIFILLPNRTGPIMQAFAPSVTLLPIEKSLPEEWRDKPITLPPTNVRFSPMMHAPLITTPIDG